MALHDDEIKLIREAITGPRTAQGMAILKLSDQDATNTLSRVVWDGQSIQESLEQLAEWNRVAERMKSGRRTSGTGRIERRCEFASAVGPTNHQKRRRYHDQRPATPGERD